MGTPVADSGLEVNVTVEDEDYSGSGTGVIARYTRTSGAWAGLREGSRLTVTDGAGTISAANEVSDAKIIRVADDGTWIEIANNAASAEAGVTGDFSIVPNYFSGNTSGADKTYIGSGYVTGTLRIEDESRVYTVAWVDEFAQEIGLSELYEGGASGEVEFVLRNEKALYWSNTYNPDVVPAGNVIETPFPIHAISSNNREILLFGDRSIVKLSADEPGQGFVYLADYVGCVAQYSIVQTPRGIGFWDGQGYSLTDGQNLLSLTKTRASHILKDVNRELQHNIRAVYLHEKDQIKFWFPVKSVTNNYGLTINLSSGDCYPERRVDVNCAWVEKSVDGQMNVFHGTSGRHTASGSGYIFEQREDEEDDGVVDGSCWHFEVSDVTNLASGNFQVTEVDGTLDAGDESTHPYQYEGMPFTVLKADGSAEYLAPIKKIVEGTPIVLHYNEGDYDLSGVEVGDKVFIGIIPVSYGWRWLDFSSPQYKHQIRHIEIDFEPPNGPAWIVVDHAYEGVASAVKRNVEYIDQYTTKVVAKLHYGKGYIYGFRIRAWADVRLKIHNISIVFATLA